MAGDKQKMVRQLILDPLEWAEKMLSSPEKPYRPSKQQKEGWEAYRRILTAKLKRAHGAPMTDQEKDDARKIGISIMSGHGTGKDAFAAAVALHFQMMQREPKVIVTAPAGPQLFTVLWPEFGKWINRSPMLKSVFEKDANKVYLKERGGNEFFIKPRTIQQNSSPEEQAEVLAGTHSYSVLYVIDEGSGVQDPVFKPIEGGATDPVSIVLIIFNPTQRNGFAIDSQAKNRQDWICLHWDAEDLKEEKLAEPQTFFWFDEQAQERLAKKYGRDSDFYRVRVRGLPPSAPPGVLIPWDWVIRSVERGKVEGLAPHEKDPLVFGLDVGGGGEDPSVLVVCRGPFVIGIHELNEFDSVKIGYWAQGLIAEYQSDADPGVQCAIGVDTAGIGVGVYSYLHTTARLDNCYSVNVQEETSQQDRFFRLRDEVWWNAREAFEKDLVVFQLSESGHITPELDGLIAELTTIKYDDEKGKVKVEGKKEMKKRGLASPNKADAFNIAQYLLMRYVSRVPRNRQRHERRRTVVSNWKTV